MGESGRLELAAEVRLETIVTAARVGAVISALRKAHPYEEPAFDLYPLAPPPPGIGIGRIGAIEPAADRASLFARIKQGLGIDALLIAGPHAGPVTRAAVCAGACGDLLDAAIASGAGLYLTGEMRHHDALKAARAGVTVVCTLHSNSERVALTRLMARLAPLLLGVGLVLSRTDVDPFSVR